MSDFILYSYFRSSASHRVRIALNLKNIKYEYRAVHLLNNGGEQLQEDYIKLNPSAQVPTLVHKGQPIGQSVAIISYLDEVTPGPRLFSSDPYKKAQILQFCEIINSGTQPLHNLSVTNELIKRGLSEEQKADWTIHMISKGLEAMESFIKEVSGTYCFDGEVTAADAFLVPQIFSAKRFKVPLDKYPTLMRVFENCCQLEAFKNAEPLKQPDAPK